jgi:hypothetical protein
MFQLASACARCNEEQSRFDEHRSLDVIAEPPSSAMTGSQPV